MNNGTRFSELFAGFVLAMFGFLVVSQQIQANADDPIITEHVLYQLDASDAPDLFYVNSHNRGSDGDVIYRGLKLGFNLSSLETRFFDCISIPLSRSGSLTTDGNDWVTVGPAKGTTVSYFSAHQPQSDFYYDLSQGYDRIPAADIPQYSTFTSFSLCEYVISIPSNNYQFKFDDSGGGHNAGYSEIIVEYATDAADNDTYIIMKGSDENPKHIPEFTLGIHVEYDCPSSCSENAVTESDVDYAMKIWQRDNIGIPDP